MNRESFKDKVFNSILFVKGYVRSKLHLTNQFAPYEPDVSKMSLIFEDTFSSVDPSNWRIGQPWGMFHPNTPNQYYGFDSVFTRNNKLVLAQEYNPKQFQTDKTYDIPFSVGLISSYKTFGYGFYEFNICLPYGSGLWPAVWLTATDTWPPEIDLLEAYSDAFESYGIKLQSNLHYGVTPNNVNAGARNHPVPSPLEKIKVSCWLTEKFIRIYYNGYLVRQITSESILSSFQNKKFMVVLNNGVRPGFEQLITNQYSEFSIYSVRIWE